MKLYDLEPKYQKFIISLYLHDDWVKDQSGRVQFRKMKRLVDKRSYQNRAAKKITEYKLTPRGKQQVEFFMRSAGLPRGPDAGIAIEKREWHHPKAKRFSKKEWTDAFREIERITDVPVRIYDDWKKDRMRIVCLDIDKALTKIAVELQWEKFTSKERLKEIGFTDCFVWLWTEYFDKLRDELRKIPHQQEFIVWTDS